jgi:hypothetical protein
VKISGLYQKYFDYSDHLVLNLETALIFSGLICIILNALTFQYQGEDYLSLNWLWVAPALLVIVFFAASKLQNFPKIAYLIKSYSLYFLAFFAFLVLLEGVQYTPFPAVDAFLGAADQTLGIKETQLIDWAYGHPLLLHALQLAYRSIVVQWLLMPLLIFVWGKNEQFNLYLIASLLAYLMGAVIYYFFPTVGPAGIFNDAHFSRAQLDLVINFKEIHQYLMVTTFDGGMIAFPSFHVLWSVISIFAFRHFAKLLFIPILVLNIVAIIATLFLGWNYLVDITCGVLVGLAAIYFARRLMRKPISQY